MAERGTDVHSDLTALEADLKRLEVEYNMFFAGRLPRPPWETRTRVTDTIKRLDRQHLSSNYAVQFRFTTLQTRFSTFVDLWDRGLRAREEGRAGPFAYGAAGVEGQARERVVRVMTLQDPAGEEDKLRELYQGVAEARQQTGQEAIPFRKFADVVTEQIRTFKEKGNDEVAFCVSVKNGKVVFTARAHARSPK